MTVQYQFCITLMTFLNIWIYKNAKNSITILDRNFIEMEVLKPIIVGIHILKPYHLLLLDEETNYSTLLKFISIAAQQPPFDIT